MSRNKGFKLIILICLMIISNILVFKYCNLESKNITVSYRLVSNKKGVYQIFFRSDTAPWDESKSEKEDYLDIANEKTLKFTIPINTLELRFDLGNEPSNMTLSDIKLSLLGKTVKLDMDQLLNKGNQNQIGGTEEIQQTLQIEAIGADSYIAYKLNSNDILDIIKYSHMFNNILKMVICVISDILILAVLKKSRSVVTLIQELNNNKVLIWGLAKNDFKTKYAGSYLGITWAFIQPIVTILIYWFVFGFGLKAGSPIKGVPFILWFMSGLVPWFFFQEALLNATNCMLEYSYLVKKVVFKISILPIVKIISSLFVHLVFVVFLFIVAAIYGFYPSQYTIQLIYYSFCTFFIVLSLSYATSAIVIFFKDLGQIINIFLQIGMWMTPIMWSYTILPEKYQWIVKLNPMYYIVAGYRDTIINHVWFFERYFQTVLFWLITLGLFVVGAIIFKKLKPHFADVL